MASFDFSQLHDVVHYLHIHPQISGLITFAIAFVESIALIGGLLPGSVTMTAIGALIGSGAIPAAPTFILASLGAFSGDFLSYGLGAYYNERLRKMWPFSKYPRLLIAGQEFFIKHGGKSVLMGRFFGPVRSVVPLIAGLMHMSLWRFVVSAVIAAILWSLIYILPGVVIGALSLELPPATATKFILIVLGIVAFGWVIFVLIHLFLKALVKMMDAAASWFWLWLRQYAVTRWLTALLCSAERPDPHRQLLLVLLSSLCFVLFFCVLRQVIMHGYLTHFNEPIFELLRSLRTQTGDNVMLAFTLLGDKHTQFLIAALFAVWLVWKRYYWAGLHWAALICLSAGTVYLIKHFYYFPRPTGLLNPQVTSSFPSGHTVLVTASFAFLVILFSCRSRQPIEKTSLFAKPVEQKQVVSFWLAAGCFVFAVMLSRIYLGAHWLLDVTGSLFLGLGCAALVGVSYLRRDSKSLNVTEAGKTFVLIFLSCWLVYGLMMFRTQQRNYTLYWPAVSMDTMTWWHQPYSEEPLFILSRLGKPEAALNIQWLGSLNDIKTLLLSKGWQEHSVRLNWKGSLNRLSPKANPQHLPVWPLLYQNQAPVLLMTKTADGTPPLYFIVWKSNITISDSKEPLWIGSVHYFVPRPRKNVLKLMPEQDRDLYRRAMEIFISDINRVPLKKWYIAESAQPTIMYPLHWDGQLVFVRF